MLKGEPETGTTLPLLPSSVFGTILRTYGVLDGSLSEDLFEARSLVEGATARLAARNALPQDIEAINEAIDLMEEAIPAYIRGENGWRICLLWMIYSIEDVPQISSHNQFYVQFVEIVHTAGTDMGLYEKNYGRHPEKYWRFG